MESRNRNAWIIAAVIVVVLCFCVVAATAAAVLSARAVRTAVREWPAVLDWQVPGQQDERIDRSFVVGEAPSLEIDNFAGQVTVRAGESDAIHVVATKRASRAGDLGRIQVDIDQQNSKVVIKTRKPSNLNNVSVLLEITAPASTRLDLRTGASNTDVRGLRNDIKLFTGAGSVVIADVIGDIDAHTGAGSMDVRRASGRVQMNTGAGAIYYEGDLQGTCRFTSGAGRIQLILPADLNMEVDLSTGLGSVNVSHTVVGQVTRRSAKGYIGTGRQGSINAFTGVGSIEMDRR